MSKTKVAITVAKTVAICIVYGIAQAVAQKIWYM